MRVLLTGARGFLGHHLAIKLLAKGHELVYPARVARRPPPPR
ncbi:MAG: NAD-dependent epimerase/dehydratase family protein, partial [Alphaproteobacteria bacterium]|nr:NAD-dependent epimerase/dehydratase family protein [Alphaproteobacteria bacterium]